MCVYVCVCVCVPALLRLQNLFCCNALLRGAPPHPTPTSFRPLGADQGVDSAVHVGPAGLRQPSVCPEQLHLHLQGGWCPPGEGGGGGEHLATSGSEVRLISGSLGCFHPSSLLFEPSALPSFFFFLH